MKQLSLAQQFMLTSLLILVSGMFGIGWWVGREIEAGVVNRTAATTALYVDSFVAPHVQSLATGNELHPYYAEELTSQLRETALGQQIGAFKLWDEEGRILYATDQAMVGQQFPVEEGLLRAWQGEVAAEISELDDAENVLERARNDRLLEMYSPVRLQGTNQIIAVAEFYHFVDDLESEIQAAQQRSWLVVGVATLLMYLLLAGFVQRASDVIVRQQRALNAQVAQLTEVLNQNAELHDRVRRAAARATALNERFLRRISAELHDGPAQDLGLALLRLDNVVAHTEPSLRNGGRATVAEDLEVVQHSLQNALQEVRAISTGLGVPQLSEATLSETVQRAVRSHERRTGTRVEQDVGELPEQAALPVKITLYRLLQESLNNAYRHAKGVGQRVAIRAVDQMLDVTISDQGPGFAGRTSEHEDRLGVLGMRERVESLGGRFEIHSTPGAGTTIHALLPLQNWEDEDE